MADKYGIVNQLIEETPQWETYSPAMRKDKLRGFYADNYAKDVAGLSPAEKQSHWDDYMNEVRVYSDSVPVRANVLGSQNNGVLKRMFDKLPDSAKESTAGVVAGGLAESPDIMASAIKRSPDLLKSFVWGLRNAVMDYGQPETLQNISEDYKRQLLQTDGQRKAQRDSNFGANNEDIVNQDAYNDYLQTPNDIIEANQGKDATVGQRQYRNELQNEQAYNALAAALKYAAYIPARGFAKTNEYLYEKLNPGRSFKEDAVGYYKDINEKIAKERPYQDEGSIQDFIQKNVAESTIQQLPLMAAAPVLGSGVLLPMGLQTAGQQYSQYRDQGLTQSEAALPAVASGIAEAVGEAAPTKALAKSIENAKGFRKTLGEVVGKDISGEMATQLAQDEADYQAQGNMLERLGKEQEARNIRERIASMAEAGIAAPMSSGLQTAAAYATGKTAKSAVDLVGKLRNNRQIDVAAANEEAGGANTDSSAIVQQPADGLESTGNLSVKASMAKAKAKREGVVDGVAANALEEYAKQNVEGAAQQQVSEQQPISGLLAYKPFPTQSNETADNLIKYSDGSYYNSANDTLLKDGKLFVRGVKKDNTLGWVDSGETVVMPNTAKKAQPQEKPKDTSLRGTLESSGMTLQEYAKQQPYKIMRDLEQARTQDKEREAYGNAFIAERKAAEAEYAAQKQEERAEDRARWKNMIAERKAFRKEMNDKLSEYQDEERRSADAEYYLTKYLDKQNQPLPEYAKKPTSNTEKKSAPSDLLRLEYNPVDSERRLKAFDKINEDTLPESPETLYSGMGGETSTKLNAIPNKGSVRAYRDLVSSLENARDISISAFGKDVTDKGKLAKAKKELARLESIVANRNAAPKIVDIKPLQDAYDNMVAANNKSIKVTGNPAFSNAALLSAKAKLEEAVANNAKARKSQDQSTRLLEYKNPVLSDPSFTFGARYSNAIPHYVSESIKNTSTVSLPKITSPTKPKTFRGDISKLENANDLYGKPTGWKYKEYDDSISLVHPETREIVSFEQKDKRSGTEKRRIVAQALSYAQDNPVIKPTENIVVNENNKPQVAQNPAKLYKNPKRVAAGVSNRRYQPKTFLQWIGERGGIYDDGGELKAMGLDKWHVGKPFAKKIIKQRNKNQQDAFGGASSDKHQHDITAIEAKEAGYLNDDSVESLLALLDKASRGDDPYSEHDREYIKVVEDKKEAERNADEGSYQRERMMAEAEQYGIETEGRDFDSVMFDVELARDMEPVDDADSYNVMDVAEPFVDDYYAEIKAMKQDGYFYEQSGESDTRYAGDAGQRETNAEGKVQSGENASRIEEGTGKSAEQAVEKTEAGEQTVIAGAEKISDKQPAERKMAEPKRAKVAQKEAGSDGGLFDVAARDQVDMFDGKLKNESIKQETEKNAEKRKAVFKKSGDFYNLEGDIAYDAAKILDIPVLKKRGSNTPEIGIPIHSADLYITLLKSAGMDVSISGNDYAKSLEQVAREKPNLSELEKYELIREYNGKWQYKMKADSSSWYSTGTKESAIEMALSAYNLGKENGTLQTKESRIEKANAEYKAKNEKQFGNLSVAELYALKNKIKRDIESYRKAGKNEFSGTGARNTRTATNNEAARQAGEELMRLDGYIKDKGYKEPKENLSALKDTIKNLRSWKYTAQEVKALFEETVANKDAIIAELSKKTKDELRKEYPPFRYANDSKDAIVKDAWSKILGNFNYYDTVSYSPFSETYEQALARQVNSQTDETIQKDKERTEKRIAERKAESEKLHEGSFKDSDRSTGVATRIVTMSKDVAGGKYSVSEQTTKQQDDTKSSKSNVKSVRDFSSYDDLRKYMYSEWMKIYEEESEQLKENFNKANDYDEKLLAGVRDDDIKAIDEAIASSRAYKIDFEQDGKVLVQFTSSMQSNRMRYASKKNFALDILKKRLKTRKLPFKQSVKINESMRNIYKELGLKPPTYSDGYGLDYEDAAKKFFGETTGEKYSVSKPTQGTPAQVVTDSIKNTFGKAADKLLDSGRVTVVQSVSDLPALEKGVYRQDAAGIFTPSGKVYILADNIASEKHAVSVFVHEVGVHAGMEQILGKDMFASVLKSVSNLKGKEVSEARNSVPDGENNPHYNEEVLAYLVEYAPDMGVVKRVISKVKQFAFKITGGKVNTLNAADYRNMAIGAIRGIARRDGVNFYTSNRDVAYSVSQKERMKVNLPTKRKLNAFWKEWFAQHRGVGNEVFNLSINRDGVMNAAQVDVEVLNNNLTKAVRKEYNGKVNELLLHQYMTEANDPDITDEMREAFAAIKPETRKALDVMRAHVDAMSTRLVDCLMETLERRINKLSKEAQKDAYLYIETDDKEGSMPDSLIPLWQQITGIEAKKGMYLNRSYEAFDNPKWKDIALGNKEIMAEATAFFKAEYPKDTDEEIRGRIGAVLQEAKDAGDLSGLVYRGSKVGSKDVSFLKKRKDVPPAIRKLLGEYIDPRVTVTRSITKMVNHIAGHKFLHAVHDVGLGKFLFDEPKGDYDTLVAPDQSRTLDPLNGLYSTPEFAQAMADLNTPNLNKEAWLKTFTSYIAMVKYGLTIWNPATHVVNFGSNIGFMIMNAHDPRAFVKTIKTLAQRTEESVANHKRATTLGIMHESVHAEEMKRVVNEVYKSGEVDAKAISRIVRKTLKGIEHAYAIEDSFWKLMGFESEIARQMKYKGMTRQEAEVVSADIIRRTYPTYSMSPKIVQALRRIPFVGSFPTFPYEVGRVTVNSLRIIGEEFAHGSKVIAFQRSIGFALAMSMGELIRAVTMAGLGLDDDDDKAVRRMSAPWQKNALMAYLGYDDNGMLQYIDLSKFDPFSYVKKPLYAIFRGASTDPADNYKSALKELATPFLGLDVGTQFLIDVLANKSSRTNRPIYGEFDSLSDQIADINKYANQTIAPGVIKNTMRVIDAIDGYNYKGQPVKLSDEIAGWFGVRKGTLNIPLSIRGAGYEFKARSAEASSKIKPVLLEGSNITENDIRDVLNDVNDLREKNYRMMSLSIDSARKFGASDLELRQSLDAAGVTRDDINAILQRRFIPYKAQDQAFKNVLERMKQESVSPEQYQERARRFNERVGILKRLINESKQMQIQGSLKPIINEANKLASNDVFMKFIAGTSSLNKRNEAAYRKVLGSVA